jgi:hypothetical protein
MMSAAEVERFKLDPKAYVKTTCINLQTQSGAVGSTVFNPNRAYDTMYCDLVPWSKFGWSTQQVMLAPQAMYSPQTIMAYYVPYLAYGTITSNNQAMAPLENVSATNPAHKFIFTGGQNGCSLLLLEGATPGTVTALHYPNSDGKQAGYPLLSRINRDKSHIKLAIDFDMYGTAQHPNACSFFYHDGTEWIGLTQPQVQGAPSMEWKRCSMSLSGSPKIVSSKASGVIS